jgi:hypothetical protein
MKERGIAGLRDLNTSLEEAPRGGSASIGVVDGGAVRFADDGADGVAADATSRGTFSFNEKFRG